MNKKSAFTIAEILISMAIIGVIAVVGYQTVQNVDRSAKYSYSNAFHSLDRALYNAMFFTSMPNPFLKTEMVNGAETDVADEEHPKRLCEMLTFYINATQINCEAPAVSDLGNEYGGEEAPTPHFVAFNGMRFYISNLMPDDDNADHKFMLIFVDINGVKRPNSMDYNPPEVEPDIFAFAALDIGRVCPLGPPEVDSRYMQTRIMYYETRNEDNEAENVVSVARFSKTSKPYYISKAEAWGYYLPENSPNRVADDFYIEANPLTYNGYIKNYINNESKIYEFLAGNLTVPETVTVKSESIAEGGYNCTAGFDVNCDVIIDKYQY